MADLQTVLNKFLQDLYAGTAGTTVPLTTLTLTGPGTGAVLTNPTSTTLALNGSLTVLSVTGTGSIQAGATQFLGFTGRGQFQSSADGLLQVENNAGTLGSTLKADALPTVASGFGGSPAITAGSTPLAGSIDVGTGGAATTGVINFNGTAFPSAPFVVVTTKLTNAVTRVSAISTTQLTLTSTTAWTANDIVSWVCVGARV